MRWKHGERVFQGKRVKRSTNSPQPASARTSQLKQAQNDALEHVPEKLKHFSAENMLQFIDFEHVLLALGDSAKAEDALEAIAQSERAEMARRPLGPF